MNIVLVVTGLPDSKTPARSVYNLNYAEELSKRGYKVDIIYLRSILPGRSVVRERKINDITVLELSFIFPFKYIKLQYFFSSIVLSLSLTSSKLREMIRKGDILHFINGSSAIYAKSLTFRRKKPYIIQYVGSDVNLNLKKHSCLKNYIKSVDKAKWITFNSKQLEIDFQKLIKVTTNSHVVYRGVKLDNFRYQFNPVNEEIELLFLGGFPNNSNLKGGFTLLEALKGLDPKLVDSDNKLNVLIGGPNSLQFKTYFGYKNININYIGAIPKEQVREHMEKSHVVVIPSLNEGLPNVLYESMATGNLVICSRVGGMPEFIEHNKTGMLFAANSPDQLEHL